MKINHLIIYKQIPLIIYMKIQKINTRFKKKFLKIFKKFKIKNNYKMMKIKNKIFNNKIQMNLI